jgi:hypothetical protein
MGEIRIHEREKQFTHRHGTKYCKYKQKDPLSFGHHQCFQAAAYPTSSAQLPGTVLEGLPFAVADHPVGVASSVGDVTAP